MDLTEQEYDTPSENALEENALGDIELNKSISSSKKVLDELISPLREKERKDNFSDVKKMFEVSRKQVRKHLSETRELFSTEDVFSSKKSEFNTFLSTFSLRVSENLRTLKNIGRKLNRSVDKVKSLEDNLKYEKEQKTSLLTVSHSLRLQVERLGFSVQIFQQEREKLEDQISKFKKFIISKDKLLIRTLMREEIEIEKLTSAISTQNFLSTKRRYIYKKLFKVCEKNRLSLRDTRSVFKVIENEFDQVQPKRYKVGNYNYGGKEVRTSEVFIEPDVVTLLKKVKTYIQEVTSAKKKQHYQFRRDVLKNHKYIIAQNEMLLNLCVDEERLKKNRPEYVTFEEVLGYITKMKDFSEEGRINLEDIFLKVGKILDTNFGFFAEKKRKFKAIKKRIKLLKETTSNIRESMIVMDNEVFDGVGDQISGFLKDFTERLENDAQSTASEKNSNMSKIAAREKKKIKETYKKKIDELTQEIKLLRGNSAFDETQKLKEQVVNERKKVEYLIKQRDQFNGEKKQLEDGLKKVRAELDFEKKKKKSGSKKLLKEIEQLKEDLEDCRNTISIKDEDIGNLHDEIKIVQENVESQALSFESEKKELNTQIKRLKEYSKKLREANEQSATSEKNMMADIKKKGRNKSSQTIGLFEVLQNGEEFTSILAEHQDQINKLVPEKKNISCQTGKTVRAGKNKVTQTKPCKMGKKHNEKIEAAVREKLEDKFQKERMEHEMKMQFLKQKLLEMDNEIESPEQEGKNSKEEGELLIEKSDLNPKKNHTITFPITARTHNSNVEMVYHDSRNCELETNYKKLQKKYNSLKTKFNIFQVSSHTGGGGGLLKKNSNTTGAQTDFSYSGKNVFQFLNQIKRAEEQEQHQNIKMQDKMLNIDYSKLSKKQIKSIIKVLHNKYKNRKAKKLKNDKFSFDNFNKETKKDSFGKRIGAESRKKLVEADKKKLEEEKQKRNELPPLNKRVVDKMISNIDMFDKSISRDLQKNDIRKKLKRLIVLTDRHKKDKKKFQLSDYKSEERRRKLEKYSKMARRGKNFKRFSNIL